MKINTSFIGASPKIDDTVLTQMNDIVAGQKAYELFLEGLNSQFSAERYDFNDCLAKFYSNELMELDQHLQSIRNDFYSETGSNLVADLKALNGFYIAAEEQCPEITDGERAV